MQIVPPALSLCTLRNWLVRSQPLFPDLDTCPSIMYKFNSNFRQNQSSGGKATDILQTGWLLVPVHVLIGQYKKPVHIGPDTSNCFTVTLVF